MKLDDFGMDTITLAGPIEAKLRAVRQAGFTQIMLSARDLVGHPEGEAAAIRAVLDSGLRVTGLQVLRDFEGLTGQLHEYKIDVAKSMLEMARAVRAPLLLVCSTTSAHAVADFDAHVADLRKLAMLAVPMGVRIAFEGLSWGRFIDDVPGAWAAVSAANRANLGLAIDSFHLLAKDTPLEALDEIDPDKLFFVQLSDFMWSAPSTPEERRETARHLRVFPGEGAHSAAVADLIRAIDRMGYEGDYSFEVFNDDYTQMQLGRVTDRARRSVAWITGHVSRRSLPVRRTAELGQHARFEVARGNARRLHAHVDRGGAAADVIAHRYGQRAQADLQLLVDDGVAVAAHAVDDLLELRRRRHGAIGVRDQAHAREIGTELVGRKSREQHASHRCAMRRKPAAEAQVDRHDAIPRRGARDVQDLVTVEDGHRARFAHDVRHAIEHRLRRRRERRRRHVRMAEFQDPRAQVERAPVLAADIAELGQCMEAPPHGGARDPGALADLRDRELTPLASERPDDREPAGERRHEVGIAGCRVHRVGGGLVGRRRRSDLALGLALRRGLGHL